MGQICKKRFMGHMAIYWAIYGPYTVTYFDGFWTKGQISVNFRNVGGIFSVSRERPQVIYITSYILDVDRANY